MVNLGREGDAPPAAAPKIRGYLEAKSRWTGDFEYEFRDQSSLLGAAMLARLTGLIAAAH